LEDAANGLTKIFTGEVHTDLLCVGQTCVTESQLQTLLNQQNNNNGGGTGNPPPDTTPPTITLIGDPSITLSVGDTYEEQGATATDDTDGDITGNIQITGTVDTTTVGIYTVTYTVTDSAGNVGEATREVVVG
jgi:hypothetical protein